MKELDRDRWSQQLLQERESERETNRNYEWRQSEAIIDSSNNPLHSFCNQYVQLEWSCPVMPSRCKTVDEGPTKPYGKTSNPH